MKIAAKEIDIRFTLEIIAVKRVILEVVKIYKIDKTYENSFNKTKYHNYIVNCYYGF